MKSHRLTLLVLIILGLTRLTPAAEIVHKIPSYTGEFEIVSQTVSKDGHECVVVFNCPRGIFRCHVDLGKADFKKVVFVVRNQSAWEGVTFSPAERESVELPNAKDVTIRADGKDCRIEFGPEAIKLLKRGGDFQFIDRYRG
jgi:hypothetical protein